MVSCSRCVVVAESKRNESIVIGYSFGIVFSEMKVIATKRNESTVRYSPLSLAHLVFADFSCIDKYNFIISVFPSKFFYSPFNLLFSISLLRKKFNSKISSSNNINKSTAWNTNRNFKTTKAKCYRKRKIVKFCKFVQIYRYYKNCVLYWCNVFRNSRF